MLGMTKGNYSDHRLERFEQRLSQLERKLNRWLTWWERNYRTAHERKARGDEESKE